MKTFTRCNIRLYLYGLIGSLLFSTGLKAQENLNYRKLINQTNAFYGSNDLLHSGEIYRPEHTYAKGHPYFLNNNYSPATVTVKGNSFDNVTAKYNIETDQLVILTPVDSNAIMMISIKRNWIDSFKINNHLFVNISDYDSSNTAKGYYELAYSGKKSFFIKHNKKFIDTYNDLSPNGFYSVPKTSFYIYDGAKFFPIKSKKNFLQFYSEKKTAVKKYMRRNKIKFLKSSTIQLNQLMQFCDGISK
jgi:hypothetical protein